MRTLWIAAVVTCIGCGGTPPPSVHTVAPTGVAEPVAHELDAGVASTEPDPPEIIVPPPVAARVLVDLDDDGRGLGGHDPVTYVARGAPTRGTTAHVERHAGAAYWFESAATREAFVADPDRYAPQYGGYCAFAAAENRVSSADPRVYQLVDGKLLVFTNRAFRSAFLRDPPGNTRRADANWPGLVERHGTSP